VPCFPKGLLRTHDTAPLDQRLLLLLLLLLLLKKLEILYPLKGSEVKVKAKAHGPPTLTLPLTLLLQVVVVAGAPGRLIVLWLRKGQWLLHRLPHHRLLNEAHTLFSPAAESKGNTY
jgi:hypothetical protein